MIAQLPWGRRPLRRAETPEVGDRGDTTELEGEADRVVGDERHPANDVEPRFIIIMWPAFFALVSPVTKNAKPTCMNSTKKPVMSNQAKLMDTRRCPASLAN